VIGQTFYIKGVPLTIIGITAQGFRGVEPWTPTEIWIPLQNRPDLPARGISGEDSPTLYGSPNWWSLMMVGRLAPEVSWDQAIAQLTPVFRSAADEGIGTPGPKDRPPQLYFFSARGVQTMREVLKDPLLILTAMVGLVLLIACLNVAVLVLARNSARQREFSLRMALGSGRSRLFRQLLTESLLLVAGGSALGWALAVWVIRALAGWSQMVPNVTPDRTVLGFALAVSAASTLVFGLVPVRSAMRGSLGLALKLASPAAGADVGKLRGARPAVAVQTALCLVLLVAAGLLVRTLRNLESVNLGLRASGLLVFGVSPPATARTDPELIRFYQALTDRLRYLTGVESATLMQARIGWRATRPEWSSTAGRLARPGRVLGCTGTPSVQTASTCLARSCSSAATSPKRIQPPPPRWVSSTKPSRGATLRGETRWGTPLRSTTGARAAATRSWESWPTANTPTCANTTSRLLISRTRRCTKLRAWG
jgi:hypothetical protein